MRRWLTTIVILLAAAAALPAGAQLRPEASMAGDPAWDVPLAAAHAAEGSWAEDPSKRVARAIEGAEDESVAPRSAEDFAYQVLMIVVSAVVSALVWKAIN